MNVEVIDHVRVTVDVAPAQVLSYCRRVLTVEWASNPKWRECKGRMRDTTAFGYGIVWEGYHTHLIEVPREVCVRYGTRIANICNSLVAWGVVEQPSDALRAMADEPVYRTNDPTEVRIAALKSTLDGVAERAKRGGT